ncbi:hypothetical protein ASPZODRAFT_149644 [Penicilliopsis zonata CBS 506.65]|uniref:C2H2-type domain-containing protein n=1 Tax=Penicilliopsis zonata CBS 506.65 TaxID=1073090 RepID=A0A1L9ST61_9EURO|nr:hypothetical protein ASPZODRAFT_149644 [Penicilliopsis zonata CBS 506.65]OJJ50283.1 hypothetical protein ASPZODRAFT_149644 [Penicilliopsis zonata CBS 506.65]
MPRAEAGSTKAISNKIKSKGLGRLRWYCQTCERQMRDENGFKCHVQSESHVRQMLLVGEDPKKFIEDYSKQFMSNFLQMLKTTHGEKKVHINQFYQQVIADKTHIHMNATKWKSLTQFAAYLGREGICRVEETEKGLFVSWIDNSPETMRKREAVLKRERQDKGDEEREQRLIQEQVERAQRNVTNPDEDSDQEAKILQRKDGEKLKLNLAFGAKPKEDAKTESPKPPSPKENKSDSTTPETDSAAAAQPAAAPSAAPVKLSMSFGDKKPKNVFAAAAKKNPLSGKKGPVLEAPKKMSEQERIMKAEMEAMERKRMRGDSGMPGPKRTKIV